MKKKFKIIYFILLIYLFPIIKRNTKKIIMITKIIVCTIVRAGNTALALSTDIESILLS